MYKYHYETGGFVSAGSEAVFDELDQHERLSAHMMQSSRMMAGGAMALKLDHGKGRRIGSLMSLQGQVLGVPIGVEQMVIDHTPPQQKIWETVGEPRLLVIGRYTMGFTVVPRPGGSMLTVFIDYDLPTGGWKIVGLLLGRFYARWCATNIVSGIVNRFV